jgi:hypothetical protein
MKLSLLAFSAAALVAAALPSVASAQLLEVGQTSTPLVAPTCPPNPKVNPCNIVLTRVTGIETLSDGHANPTTIRRAGEIVALNIGLSALSRTTKTRDADVKALNSHYGGAPRAEVTVLRPYNRKQFEWKVAANSAPIFLQHYLGQVAQFPLSQPVKVVPGERIALTVPTWAPVLALKLATNKFAYRQSRSGSAKTCAPPPSTQKAQLRVGQIAAYKCNYIGTRLEYSVTEVTTPTPSS